MSVAIEDAMKRLDGALGLLEAAVTRRLDSEIRRGDLDTELQLMQDDRARLAVELDGAVARLHRVEAVTEDVERRVQRAIGSVRGVIERASPPVAHES